MQLTTTVPPTSDERIPFHLSIVIKSQKENILMETELGSEVGAAGRLFKNCIDLWWALMQRLSILPRFKDAQKRALRTEFGRLYFWGDGFYPFDGQLDQILSYSKRLQNRVLSILVDLGSILCNERSGLYSLVSRIISDEKLRLQKRELATLADSVRLTLEDVASETSDSDSGSELGDEVNQLQEIILTLRSRNQCLIDLSGSLERPAADPDMQEASSQPALVVSNPGEMWTRKVLDTFPKLQTAIAVRLGEANWRRYQRVAKKLEESAPFEDSSDSDSDDETASRGKLDTDFTKSSIDPSTIFSSTGLQPSTMASSISAPDLDYAFPLPQRRATKDVKSQATYTSFMTDDEGERGWLKIPAMPEGADSGKSFRCTVCGDKLSEIFDKSHWKRHVFSDLEPYICTFEGCKIGLKTFKTRREWADHEFSIHRKKRIWVCQDCASTIDQREQMLDHAQIHHYNKLALNQLEILVNSAEHPAGKSEDSTCPFCMETIGVKPRNFAMHVGRHMEEVALAVLPRDSKFEEDDRSSESGKDDFSEFGEGDYFTTNTENLIGEVPKAASEVPSNVPPNPEDKPKRARIGLDRFLFLSVLGRGNTGKVFLAETKANRNLYAIKVVKKEFSIENDDVERHKEAKRVLVRVQEKQCPFIIKLNATFQTETRLYFVMEYASGGDLMFHIQKGQFGSRRAQFYAAEVVLGLEFLHGMGVLYRDLKLGNTVLMADGHIKLAGFGYVKPGMSQTSTTSTFCGTPEFMAPEMLLDKHYGLAIDWWAFGVMLYEMLLQQSPFRGDNEDEIYDAILADEPLFPIHMPRDTVDILQKLLRRDPKIRLGFNGPSEVKQHVFWRNIDWKKIERREVPPSFVPIYDGKGKAINFDYEFTSTEPVLTPVQSVLTAAMQEEFRGFSWGAID